MTSLITAQYRPPDNGALAGAGVGAGDMEHIYIDEQNADRTYVVRYTINVKYMNSKR